MASVESMGELVSHQRLFMLKSKELSALSHQTRHKFLSFDSMRITIAAFASTALATKIYLDDTDIQFSDD